VVAPALGTFVAKELMVLKYSYQFIFHFLVHDRFRLLDSLKKQMGFTLIELLVAIAILSILAAMAISQYRSYKVRAFDTSARSHIKNALTAVEDYFIQQGSYPANYTDLVVSGFNMSSDVCFTKYELDDGGTTVHFHLMHTASPNNWHTRYPGDAGSLAHRNPASCI